MSNKTYRSKDDIKRIKELEAEIEETQIELTNCARHWRSELAMAEVKQAELQAENQQLKEEAIMSLFEPDYETLLDHRQSKGNEMKTQRQRAAAKRALDRRDSINAAERAGNHCERCRKFSVFHTERATARGSR